MFLTERKKSILRVAICFFRAPRHVLFAIAPDLVDGVLRPFVVAFGTFWKVKQRHETACGADNGFWLAVVASGTAYIARHSVFLSDLHFNKSGNYGAYHDGNHHGVPHCLVA